MILHASRAKGWLPARARAVEQVPFKVPRSRSNVWCRRRPVLITSERLGDLFKPASMQRHKSCLILSHLGESGVGGNAVAIRMKLVSCLVAACMWIWVTKIARIGIKTPGPECIARIPSRVCRHDQPRPAASRLRTPDGRSTFASCLSFLSPCRLQFSLQRQRWHLRQQRRRSLRSTTNSSSPTHSFGVSVSSSMR